MEEIIKTAEKLKFRHLGMLLLQNRKNSKTPKKYINIQNSIPDKWTKIDITLL